jgi:hypothetical protein
LLKLNNYIYHNQSFTLSLSLWHHMNHFKSGGTK